MDIQTTKLELLKIIIENNDSDFLKKISDFVNKEKKDFWHELDATKQQEIRKGIDELHKGKRVSYDSFLKKIS